MKLIRTKPKNQIVIVDQEEFDKIENLSNLNEREIELIATKKFIDYVRDSGVKLDIRFNEIDFYIKNKSLVFEYNYNEQSFPKTFSNSFKNWISKEIVNEINKNFENYACEYRDIVIYECKMYKENINRQLLFFKILSLSLLFLIVLQFILS